MLCKDFETVPSDISNIEDIEAKGLSAKKESFKLIILACFKFLTSDATSSVCAKRFQDAWLTGSTLVSSRMSGTMIFIGSDGS